ncbi:MAG: NAD-dependent epimerase/dehydratase family protein [Catalinimonas sp.]
MILITGASGLVGRWLVEAFADAGHPVQAMVRRPPVRALSPLAEVVQGDLLDLPRLRELCRGVDAVVHAAGMVRLAGGGRRAMRRVNVEGTANILAAAQAEGVGWFGHVSSVAALGQPTPTDRANTGQPLWIDETAMWQAGTDTTPYARTKYEAEREVWRAAAEGLPVCVVNPSVVLAPEERSSGQLVRYAWEERRYYPPGHVNYVDVRDVAEIVRRLYERHTQHQRFIVSAGAVSYQELFARMATLMDRRPPPARLTPGVGALAWRADKIRTLVTRTPRRVSRSMLQRFGRQDHFDAGKVRRHLAYEFRPLEETLAWVCREWRANYAPPAPISP